VTAAPEAGRRENELGGRRPAGNVRDAMTPTEEVRPMNAVTVWVLPVGIMAGD
jgi:hypothetical protein